MASRVVVPGSAVLTIPVHYGNDEALPWSMAQVGGSAPVGSLIDRTWKEIAIGAMYVNLLLDSGIDRDQERYSRFLDAVLASEGISIEDIVGLAEKGASSKDLYIVHRGAVVFACERGFFSKRIEVQRVCSIASIASLRTTRQGFKPPEIAIIAYGRDGKEVSKIVWRLGFEDWEKQLAIQQCKHLFGVIGAAMDKFAEVPPRASVSTASSKAAALRQWAADIVKESGVEVTHDRIEEHADMIAAGIRFSLFLPLGMDSLGIDDLQDFFPGGDMPPGRPIETFDKLYTQVVTLTGLADLIDQGIDKEMTASWHEFVRGCREQYS